MTLSASAVSKKRLDKIQSHRPEVKDSASIDLEWIPYKGKYEHDKTNIFAACFCTNWGDRIVLHISRYSSSPNPEKALIQDILLYLNQFPLTFGWYSTGVEVYDDKTGLRVRGHNSDLFLLHQRCIFHHLSSPVELKKTYARFKDPNKKHIDLYKVFENPIVQRDLFDEKYRTTALDAVSRVLLGVGKYGKLNAGNTDICSLRVEEQMRYVRLQENNIIYGKLNAGNTDICSLPVEEQMRYARLQENNINRKVDRYWVCRKRKGVYPIVLEQTLADRNKYLNLKKEEQYKANPDPNLIEEYQTHQIGAKLFANAGYGVFNNEYFEFANYQVAECITGEGRRIHKEMERLAESEPSNFEIVFGFTDSTFVNRATETKVEDFIRRCKDELGVTVEKTVYTNSIFYGKKNRFAAWTGNQKDEPVIKGLEGLSNSNPLWVQKWFKRIVSKLVKHPETRFEVIPQMIKEAFDELVLVGNDSHHHHQINYEEELKFTHKLSKDPHEYKGNSRTARLAKLLDKDKGGLVYWYETYTQEYVKSKQCWKKKKGYSVKLENLNLDEYKNLLLTKLKDSLEITSFNTVAMERELLERKTVSHMIMPSRGVAGMNSFTRLLSGVSQ
jgi:DNA polymerase family B